MEIREVLNKQQSREFLLFPLEIYRDDPNWIRPLDKDMEEVFDPARNKFFRHGQCTRFLLYNSENKLIGRIAAFINNKTAHKQDQPTGGIGFFECINSHEAAAILFNTAIEWLKVRGMQAMDGPINFGERDSWWGLIVEGFHSPQYKMNYNPPYYKELFEEFGFRTYFEQWCFSRQAKKPLDPKFYERHKKIAENPDYHAEFLRKKNLAKYAEDFRIIYNAAWAKHGGGKELESRQVLSFFRAMKPVIDERIIWYIYYKKEPVAVWINLPDINQIFKKFNGKFGWLEKLRFIFDLKTNKIKKFIGLVFGIVPAHQGKGVDSYMIVEGAKLIQGVKLLYDQFEMQWIGDFNPKMLSIAENLDTDRSRVLITYRYLFDRNKEFKRHPTL